VSKVEPTIWPILPHTTAKHTILRTYLDAWFPIMSRYPRVVFLDGFAGPGRYENGEPGSPIVALESAMTHKAKLSKELAFLFVEERNDRADHLAKEIEKLKCPSNFKTEVKCGVFAPTLRTILDDLAKRDLKLAPTFAMIDPFGFAGIPYDLMKRLLENPSCELFVSFMVDSINRWLRHPDKEIRTHIHEAFGSDEPFRLIEEAGDRVMALTELYRERLGTIARFVRSFELRDKNDRVVYHLFFASKNSRGHHKMKEAMWKVDPLGDFSFSDATNPQQLVFFQSSYQEVLKAGLRRQFANAKNILINKVEAHVIDNTAFLPKHMREVLPLLEEEGRIRIGDLKGDGSKRKKNTYPNSAYITFI
jgi:three-Cys-motif partner protein